MNYLKNQIQNKQESNIIERQIIGTIGSESKREIALKLVQNIKELWFLNEENLMMFKIIKHGLINKESFIPEIIKNSLSSTFAECIELGPIREEECVKLPEKLKNIWLKYKTQETIQKYSEVKIEDPHKQISIVINDLTKIQDGHETEISNISYLEELFEKESQEYKEKREKGDSLIGYETGFKDLDNAIDGLRKGHLWIASGYTSQGKTYFALNIIKKLIDQQIPVSMYSLEMSKVDIYKRMLGIISDVSGGYLLKGNLNEELKEKKNKAMEYLRNSNLRVHTEKTDLDEIMTNMIIEYQTNRAKVFVIDYAQIIKAGGDSLYENMRRVATELQAFCRKNNIPVILISQISNESARTQDSNVIGLKGAGDLAASADITLELARSDEESKEQREMKMSEGKPVRVKLVCKKNRHGRIFTSELWFQPKTGNFYNEDPEMTNF